MQITGNDLIAAFEQFAPPSLAIPHDPIGIQIGDGNRVIHTVLVTLDVRPAVVEEAVALHADMIFAHHPVVFHPAKNLNYADPQHALYAELIRQNILVYAAHTNYDRASGGMNDVLATTLGLADVQPFIADGEGTNMGRIGQLPTTMSLAAFIDQVKQQLELNGVRVIARNLQRPVRTVAVLGGSGSEWWPDALAAGADVYVTGDVTYHTGHDMLAADLPVIDAGHHIEHVMKQAVRTKLMSWAQENDWAVQILAAALNTDPFTFR